jgi:hypothetical protein
MSARVGRTSTGHLGVRHALALLGVPAVLQVRERPVRRAEEHGRIATWGIVRCSPGRDALQVDRTEPRGRNPFCTTRYRVGGAATAALRWHGREAP